MTGEGLARRTDTALFGALLAPGLNASVMPVTPGQACEVAPESDLGTGPIMQAAGPSADLPLRVRCAPFGELGLAMKHADHEGRVGKQQAVVPADAGIAGKAGDEKQFDHGNSPDVLDPGDRGSKGWERREAGPATGRGPAGGLIPRRAGFRPGPARPEGQGPGRGSGEQVLEDRVRIVDDPAAVAHAVAETPRRRDAAAAPAGDPRSRRNWRSRSAWRAAGACPASSPRTVPRWCRSRPAGR